MDDEIDLRPYLELLIQHWKWWVGAAIIAGIAAFVMLSFRPPSYEATALVAILEGDQIVQFDSRIRSVEEDQPAQAYPELAVSDDFLLVLLPEITSIFPEVNTVQAVRGMLEAEAGDDRSLLRLKARSQDPEKTTALVNIWAEQFVKKANSIYGGQSGDQLIFFEAQLENASLQLDIVEQALVDFQLRNRATIISEQTRTYGDTLGDYLEKKRDITLLLQDVASLYALLNNVDSDVTASTQVASLILQARAFAGTRGTTTDMIQIQLDMNQLSDATRAEQLAMLTGLQEVLQVQVGQIDESIAELEPQLLLLQQQQQDAEVQAARRIRDVSVAEETYTALAHKVEEERITSQDTGSGVRLASRASIPNSPVSAGRILLSMAAAVAAAMFVAFIIVVIGWWKKQGVDEV